ncbi:FAD-dependent oxidoreductase, partial [Candidatus Entotheonella palauensis]|uniref:FAD-dependent oxidoreductase n=1 Tax=Candidatus Entotheonella palauensis TaxID=93172 RepID=UPI000B7E5187
PRKQAGHAGRSINLALSTRGLHGLQHAGLADTVRQRSIKMPGRIIHTLDGETRFQPYGVNPSEVLYAISRAELQHLLLDALAHTPNVHLNFDTKCVEMHLAQQTLTLSHELTGEITTLIRPHVIGTDGSSSAVRSAMLRTPRFDYAQTYLEHGYKELTLPPAPDGTFQLDPHALHIWPRGTYMLIALPNLDCSFTCTLFMPFSGSVSFEALSTPDAITMFFEQQFPDVVPLIPDLVKDFTANPTGSLVTIKCSPWHYRDHLLLLGDAAHAIVPFFGQGMNCAFEDCTELDACIEAETPDWERVFAAFFSRRKPNTDAIADMAIDHYIEMRDHVADPHFLLQKQIEQELAKRFPKQYIPQYSLVTFQRIPYAQAREQARIHERILQQLSAHINHPDQVDWQQAEHLIQRELPLSREGAA